MKAILAGTSEGQVALGSLSENQAGQMQSAAIQSNSSNRSPSIAKPTGPLKKGMFWVP